MATCGRQEPLRAAVGPICAGLAVLAACSPATKPGGTATLHTAAPTSAATTTTDSWAVPSTITPAYLDRVLIELNHIDGDAFRDARAHDAVTPTFVRLEQSIRAGPHELELQEAGIDREVQIAWVGIKEVPGDRIMRVGSILSAPQPCVLAAVAIDLSGVTVGAPQTYPQWYVALVPATPDVTNATHWLVADDGFESGGGPPAPAHACATS